MPTSPVRYLPAICLMLLLGPFSSSQALVLRVDYSLDTQGFFDDPLRRDLFELAVDTVNRWQNPLAPIVPEGTNTWTTYITRPDGLGSLIEQDRSIADREVIVFAGGHPFFAAGRLAFMSPSFHFAEGDSAWIALTSSRGQAGAPQTTHAPWGGSAVFSDRKNSDGSPEIDWFFGQDINLIQPGQIDFLTVAMHELVHLLGFGPSAAHVNLTKNGRFNGQAAKAVGSPNNPNLVIHEGASGDHWLYQFDPQQGIDNPTLSYVNGQLQPALLNPFIVEGERWLPTDLDMAALQDLGWIPALAGDLNRDGMVTVAEAVSVFANIGKTNVGWSQGDFNGSMTVTIQDAVGAFANISSTQEAAVISPAAMIPEPASLALLGLGSLALLRRRPA